MNNYQEEYNELIGNANAFFEIQNGITYDKERDFKQTTIIENISYNGYNSLKRFEVKLKSLSALIEYDIEQILDTQMIGLHCDNKLIKVLLELEKNFTIIDNSIIHKGFTLEQRKTTKANIDQSFFHGYIQIAYESIRELNRKHLAIGKFEKLFIGHPNEQNSNISIVENALYNLKIVDQNGVSILNDRGKAILWAMITYLKEQKIIKEESEETYINIFWKLIRGIGKAPIKPHRDTNAYERAKKTIVGYFEKTELTTINDRT